MGKGIEERIAVSAPFKLDRQQLQVTCFDLARTTLWSKRPTDVSTIQLLANRLFTLAIEYEEFVIGQHRDPNLITRAVGYLGHTQAMPPMRDDISWFSDMLAVLIELACPNCGANSAFEEWYRDIEHGIASCRAGYE
jgi:hypothetical protein